jgi:hypothetical protein
MELVIIIVISNDSYILINYDSAHHSMLNNRDG